MQRVSVGAHREGAHTSGMCWPLLDKPQSRQNTPVAIRGQLLEGTCISHILAVECDGKAYHSSYSARANDRLRQEMLEGKGWNFFRIWSTDWFRDPISELDQLDKLVKKLSSSNR